MNNIPNEGTIFSTTFRLLLNNAKAEKIQLLKQSLTALGEVEKCEVALDFYHGFNTKGRRIGKKIYVPSNGHGVAKFMIRTMDGKEIPFHTICTFYELGQFMSEAGPYMRNSEFHKSFWIEETKSSQYYIVFKVELAT